jgi:hypothetical protein
LDQRNVFYAGPDGGVKTALSLAGYTLVSDHVKADVFVLNGEIPSTGWGQAPDAAAVVAW